MKKNLFVAILVTAVFLAGFLLVLSEILKEATPAPTDPTGASDSLASTAASSPSQSTTATTAPTAPPVTKVSTATIGATGDILLHDLVIRSGKQADGSYCYDNIFKYYEKFTSQMDLAVANLEVTLCGEDNGYSYSGYPCFNSPDAIVDALKNAGFDLLLTANNHCYDTGHTGLLRTQQVIADRGLDHIGTRPTSSAPNYLVKEVNGIHLGMVCYTYNTAESESGAVSLNGIGLSAEDSQLVNSFSYKKLSSFYSRLSLQLEQMRRQGAEAIILYIHWGDEYDTTPNAIQKQMAQELCNLGIDVIVGNHAHVIQPIELLTCQEDPQKKTVCLYSTGNAVSNIYKVSHFPVETEDGVLFQMTFAKYSDGTVLLQSVDALPTWVHRYYDDNWTRMYTILPLDENTQQYQQSMSLTDSTLNQCLASRQRTLALIGQGLSQSNQWCKQQQLQTEAALGVK